MQVTQLGVTGQDLNTGLTWDSSACCLGGEGSGELDASGPGLCSWAGREEGGGGVTGQGVHIWSLPRFLTCSSSRPWTVLGGRGVFCSDEVTPVGFSMGLVTRRAKPRLEEDLSFPWEGRGAGDRVPVPCNLPKHRSSPGVAELSGCQEGRGWEGGVPRGEGRGAPRYPRPSL